MTVYIVLAAIALLLVVAAVMWVRERHWATLYEGASEHVGPATALNHALQAEGVRSRLEMTPPRPQGAPGLNLDQPLGQSVRVRVHSDDIERALEIHARADWRMG